MEEFFNPNLMKGWEKVSGFGPQYPNKLVWRNEMLKDRKVINLDAWNSIDKTLGNNHGDLD